jgi:hypothetical protein
MGARARKQGEGRVTPSPRKWPHWPRKTVAKVAVLHNDVPN